MSAPCCCRLVGAHRGGPGAGIGLQVGQRGGCSWDSGVVGGAAGVGLEVGLGSGWRPSLWSAITYDGAARKHQQQRSSVGDPLHGSTVSLLPGLSTFPLSHLPAVPTIAGGNNKSEQTRTQKCLDLSHCPLSTLSGPVLAFSGQHSLETGRAGALAVALVSLRWHAHS